MQNQENIISKKMGTNKIVYNVIKLEDNIQVKQRIA